MAMDGGGLCPLPLSFAFPTSSGSPHITNPGIAGATGGLRTERWDGQAYTSTSETVPFPNDDTVQITLLKLVEDIPEFAIQVAYFSVGEFDVYTAVRYPERPG